MKKSVKKIHATKKPKLKKVDVLDKNGKVIDTIEVDENEIPIHDVCQCESYDD